MERETLDRFSKRKSDHMAIALRSEVDANGSGFESIALEHCALPELDLNEVTLATQSLGIEHRTPFIISSMTAGHADGVDFNLRLARVAAGRGWMMGVGSQRRELTDDTAAIEWKNLRKVAPGLTLLSNVGLAQVIEHNVDDIQRLVDSLEAQALIVHLNALQESLQIEGTPNFAQGLKSLERLCKTLKVPVVIKETGCGFSKRDLIRLNEIGVQAVDVSGYGGTHWGRIEGLRAMADHSNASNIKTKAAVTFANWGNSTIDVLRMAALLKPKYETWASGGIRSGLDAAKSIAMGAKIVGIAKPLLAAALTSEEALDQTMNQFEYELKVALFCTGNKTTLDLMTSAPWIRKSV